MAVYGVHRCGQCDGRKTAYYNDGQGQRGHIPCPSCDGEGEVVPASQLQGAVEALEKIANPAHRPRTEEAALVLIETEQIAQAALDRLRGQ